MRVGFGTGPEERGGKPGRQPLPPARGEGWPAGLGIALSAALVLSLIGALLAIALA